MSFEKKIKQHFRTCHLCEAMCGIVIEHDNKEVISIKGDKKDPLSRGHICPKAYGLKYLYEDPDRLKQPIKKVDGKWEKISWDEAYDEVAKNIDKVQKKYGNDSVGIYSGNPSVHNYGTILFGNKLFRAIRSKNMFSATSVDQLPHHFVSQFMLGHWLLLPVPDLDRADHFLILGGNPLVSNGSMMTAPDISKRLRDVQSRGKVVVIDPRKTETANKADEHHFIVPGTDVFLLLAMLNVIFKEDKIDLGHLKKMVKGLEDVENIVKDFTPQSVENICKIPADKIKQIALDFANAKRASCYGRMGVSVQEYGGLCQWLIYVINIVTDNFDKEGGVMFSRPAVQTVRGGSTIKRFNRWQSRVRKLPEFASELPVSTMAEEILTPGKGQIKAMVISAGNPVLSTPNGTQVDKAFESLEYMVSIDIYLNETSRHANIILPPAMGLETDHFDLVFSNFTVRNTVKYTEPLFKPGPNTQYDWQIYKALAKRISKEKLSTKNKFIRRWETPKRLLNFGIMLGPYGMLKNGKFNKGGLRLSLLKKHPHGIDLGPLKPSLSKQIRTKDKKIDLAPSIITQDMSRVIMAFESSKKPTESLLLISRRHLLSNNSWHHNFAKLTRGKNRCTILINPLDAHQKNIKNNQLVNVISRVGSVEIEAEISEDIMIGTVCMPHGYGHNRDGVKLEHAVQNPGVSINDLNDDKLLDTLTGNAAFSGLEVEVKGI